MMAYGEDTGAAKLAYRVNNPTDGPSLIAQVQDLQKSIEEAHLRLNRLAEAESAPDAARTVSPTDSSGVPLALRIQSVSFLVGGCHRGVLDLIRRIDRLSDEATALA